MKTFEEGLEEAKKCNGWVLTDLFDDETISEVEMKIAEVYHDKLQKKLNEKIEMEKECLKMQE